MGFPHGCRRHPVAVILAVQQRRSSGQRHASGHRRISRSAATPRAGVRVTARPLGINCPATKRRGLLGQYKPADQTLSSTSPRRYSRASAGGDWRAMRTTRRLLVVAIGSASLPAHSGFPHAADHDHQTLRARWWLRSIILVIAMVHPHLMLPASAAPSGNCACSRKHQPPIVSIRRTRTQHQTRTRAMHPHIAASTGFVETRLIDSSDIRARCSPSWKLEMLVLKRLCEGRQRRDMCGYDQRPPHHPQPTGRAAFAGCSGVNLHNETV